MTQAVGSFGFRLQFKVKGFGDLTAHDLRVRVTRPNGTSFDRLTPADVVVLSAAADFAWSLLGVRIITGDLTEQGTYKYQVWDETGGGKVKTNVQTFDVGPTLPDPAP